MNNEPNFGAPAESFPSTPTPAPVQPVPFGAAAPAESQTPQPSQKFAIFSFIAGIAAFATGFFFLGILLGIAAIVLGIVAIKKKSTGKGLIITGIITGSIGLLSGILFTVISIFALTGGFLDTAVTEKADYEIAAEKRAVQEAKYIAQKKTFAQGETAQFADVSVKVNSVQDNYVAPVQPNRADYGSDESWQYATALTAVNPTRGKKFVLLNVTVKNTSENLLEEYDYQLKGFTGSNEELDHLNFASPLLIKQVGVPFASYKELKPGEEVTAFVMYEIPTADTVSALRYTISVTDPKVQEQTDLVYTLAL